MLNDSFSTALLGNPYVFMVVVFIVTILLPESIYSYLTNLSIKERLTKVSGSVVCAMAISAVLCLLSFANMTWVLKIDAVYTVDSRVVIDPVYGGISVTVQLLIYIIASLMFVYSTVSLTNAEKKLSHTVSKMLIMLLFYSAAVANLFFLQLGMSEKIECSNYIISVIYVCMAAPFVVYAVGMLLTGLVVRRAASKASEKAPREDGRTPEQRIAQAENEKADNEFMSISTEPEKPDAAIKRAETQAEIERSLEHVAQVTQEIAAAALKLPDPVPEDDVAKSESNVEELPYVAERTAALKAAEAPKPTASEIMVNVRLAEDEPQAEASEEMHEQPEEISEADDETDDTTADKAAQPAEPVHAKGSRKKHKNKKRHAGSMKK